MMPKKIINPSEEYDKLVERLIKDLKNGSIYWIKAYANDEWILAKYNAEACSFSPFTNKGEPVYEIGITNVTNVYAVSLTPIAQPPKQ